MQEFQGDLEKRIPELKGRLTFHSVDTLHQEQFRQHIDETSRRLFDLCSAIDEVLSRSREYLRLETAEEAKPLTLAVTIDPEGNLSRLQKVIPDS